MFVTMKNTNSKILRKYIGLSYISSLILLACGAAAAGTKNYFSAGTVTLIGVTIFLLTLFIGRKRRHAISLYLQTVLDDKFGSAEHFVKNIPMPMAICSIDGTLRWYNDIFAAIFKETDLSGQVLDDCITDIKWSEVLKHPNGHEIKTILNGRTYLVRWYMIKDTVSREEGGDSYSVFIYMNDITYVKQLEKNYKDERVDVGIINIDNYDEFTQKTDDDSLDLAASKIRNTLVMWAKNGNALIKKTDRDRYFIAFEHRNLQKYISTNFDVVEKVREIAGEIRFPISLSVGIGSGGSLTENEASARTALELALGRGGGQVCVKDDKQFKFYGGKSKEYERSSRVKARSVATALKDLFVESDNVIFMGHKNADYDCFGAAVGLQRGVREAGAKPYIVHERMSPAIESMYNMLKNEPEYEGMFVDENEVYECVTPDTLLVVLDTHRPSMLPCKELLDRAGKVVLIDHHRRSTEFISPCSLVYHEPYASSTCEMVTELLEYMGAGNSLTKSEAHCLYTGILMDTKQFMLKTGVRTFEAASYLRRLGLNTVEVRRMFCSTKDDYKLKTEIVNSSCMVAKNVALAKCYKKYNNIRMIASQAADELLTLTEVCASVVVYQAEGGAGFCARSLGGLNVQLIMEKLGGGGHMTVSGAYIKDISVDEGAVRAEQAIKSYLNEIEKAN